MSKMSEYEEQQRNKLMTVLEAAELNRGFYTELDIRTIGSDPGASMRIQAHLLRKWLSGYEKK